jgi:hypothetical protein
VPTNRWAAPDLPADPQAALTILGPSLKRLEQALAATPQAYGFRITSADTTLTDTDETLVAKTGSGSVQVTLPDAADYAGREFTVKKSSASNTLTVVPTGSDTVEGASSLAWTDDQESYVLRSVLLTAPHTYGWVAVASHRPGVGGAGGAPFNSQYIVVAGDGSLTHERTLVGTTNEITTTDGGANSTFTLGLATNVRERVVGITIDGAGSPITTGYKKSIQVPWSGTITGWTILADVAGVVRFDVTKSTYAGYPPSTSIVASAPPTLSGTAAATSTTLTGWTTSLTAADILSFSVTLASACTWVTFEIYVRIP